MVSLWYDHFIIYLITSKVLSVIFYGSLCLLTGTKKNIDVKNEFQNIVCTNTPAHFSVLSNY
jgi:hypothetical protein